MKRKLTQEIVTQIRKELANPDAIQKEIAIKFDITPNMVCAIKNNKAYPIKQNIDSPQFDTSELENYIQKLENKIRETEESTKKRIMEVESIINIKFDNLESSFKNFDNKLSVKLKASDILSLKISNEAEEEDQTIGHIFYEITKRSKEVKDVLIRLNPFIKGLE